MNKPDKICKIKIIFCDNIITIIYCPYNYLINTRSKKIGSKFCCYARTLAFCLVKEATKHRDEIKSNIVSVSFLFDFGFSGLHHYFASSGQESKT